MVTNYANSRSNLFEAARLSYKRHDLLSWNNSRFQTTNSFFRDPVRHEHESSQNLLVRRTTVIPVNCLLTKWFTCKIIQPNRCHPCTIWNYTQGFENTNTSNFQTGQDLNLRVFSTPGQSWKGLIHLQWLWDWKLTKPQQVGGSI